MNFIGLLISYDTVLQILTFGIQTFSHKEQQNRNFQYQSGVKIFSNKSKKAVESFLKYKL